MKKSKLRFERNKGLIDILAIESPMHRHVRHQGRYLCLGEYD